MTTNQFLSVCLWTANSGQHADRKTSANSLIKTEHCRSIEVAVDEFGARHGERILDAILHGLPA
jgi:hypothetical protein